MRVGGSELAGACGNPSRVWAVWADGEGPREGERAQREVEQDWQRQLTPLQFRVLRQRQTEDAGSGEHISTAAAGTYSCAGCGLQLYHSKHKFAPEASVHGWPAFFDNMEGEPQHSPRTHTAEFPCSDAAMNRSFWAEPLFHSLEGAALKLNKRACACE